MPSSADIASSKAFNRANEFSSGNTFAPGDLARDRSSGVDSFTTSSAPTGKQFSSDAGGTPPKMGEPGGPPRGIPGFNDDVGASQSYAGGAILEFPSDIGLSKSQRNYMTFAPYKIIGGFGSKREEGDYQLALNPICLPIPTGITTTYAHDWSQADVNATQSYVGESMNTSLRRAGAAGVNKLSTAVTVQDNGGEAGQNLSLYGGAIAGISKIASEFNQQSVKNALSASVIGVLADAPGVGRPLAQATGLASFTETAITYGGPAYREFGYTFRLIPGSEMENETIRLIVERFKICAAPEQHSASIYRIYSLPYVFQIKFYNHTSEHTHIPKIGKCALTNFSVVHGGDRFAVHNDGAPVQTDITLQFREIELLDKARIEEGF
jgi:hypothetical protein